MSLCLVNIHGDIEGDYDIIKDLPRNATNGDVIKAIFKSRDLSIIQERLEHTHWWNAPYKGRK